MDANNKNSFSLPNLGVGKLATSRNKEHVQKSGLKEASNKISRSNSNANLSVNEEEVLLDLGVKKVGIRNVKLPTKFGTQESNQTSQKSIHHIQFVGKEFEDSVVRSSINMFGNPHKETIKEGYLKNQRDAYLTARGKETERFTSIKSESKIGGYVKDL